MGTGHSQQNYLSWLVPFPLGFYGNIFDLQVVLIVREFDTIFMYEYISFSFISLHFCSYFMYLFIYFYFSAQKKISGTNEMSFVKYIFHVHFQENPSTQTNLFVCLQNDKCVVEILV